MHIHSGSFASRVETTWASHPLNDEVYDQPEDLRRKKKLSWHSSVVLRGVTRSAGAALSAKIGVSVSWGVTDAVKHTRLVSGRLSDPQVGPEPIALTNLRKQGQLFGRGYAQVWV